MHNYPSPRTPGSTPMSPLHEWEYSRMSSATPTPSPRPHWSDAQTPRRPATRAAHTRVSSYSTKSTFSPRPPRDSPRYNSSGEYATVDEVPSYKNEYSRGSYHEPPTMPHSRPPTSFSHSRKASASIPQRPSTVRPQARHANPVPRPVQPITTPPPPRATERDAARHKIPANYSLKNWDPNEEPILLLGSVFDANSLGKWIYDWTIFNVGSSGQIVGTAGELWLLILDVAEKTKRAENIVGRVRSKQKREIVDDFLDGGERLMDFFREILKACETAMLRTDTPQRPGLGQTAGTEFVETLFGPDRQLKRTETFMAKVRKWKLGFEHNVDIILDHPTD